MLMASTNAHSLHLLSHLISFKSNQQAFYLSDWLAQLTGHYLSSRKNTIYKLACERASKERTIEGESERYRKLFLESLQSVCCAAVKRVRRNRCAHSLQCIAANKRLLSLFRFGWFERLNSNNIDDDDEWLLLSWTTTDWVLEQVEGTHVLFLLSVV